jgi:hypothetical protein
LVEILNPGRWVLKGRTEERKDLGMKAPFAFLPCPFWTEGLKDRKYMIHAAVRKTGRKKGSKAGKKAGGNPQTPTYLSERTQGGWLPAHKPPSGISFEFQDGEIWKWVDLRESVEQKGE